MSKSHPLYEKCEFCDGTRKTVTETIDRAGKPPLPVGSECRFCSTGYNEIGMTDTQLVAALDERDALLELVERVAVRRTLYETESIRGEAAKLVAGKGARVAEYRHRKGLDEDGKPNRKSP